MISIRARGLMLAVMRKEIITRLWQPRRENTIWFCLITMNTSKTRQHGSLIKSAHLWMVAE